MLKFKDFVGLRGDVQAVRERMARAGEYRRFVEGALSRYGVKDVHDLDDESYGKFMEELKGYRKKARMVAEATEGAVPPEDVKRELDDHFPRVVQIVSEVVGDFDAYLESLEPPKIVVVPDAECDPAVTGPMLQKRFLTGFSFGPLEVEVRIGVKRTTHNLYCGTVR